MFNVILVLILYEKGGNILTRYRLRKILSTIAGYMELVVAFIIIVSVILASVNLAVDLGKYGIHLFDGSNYSVTYSAVFSSAIIIVIGIEMIKMIVKHTPASVLEVLLFVIAKRVVADSEFGSLDMLLCVLAIAIIFAIKKFLHFDSYKSKDGITFGAETKVDDIKSFLHIDLPKNIGETIGEIVEGEFHRLERKIAEGEEIAFNDALFRIYSMEDDEIKKIEIVTKKKNFK